MFAVGDEAAPPDMQTFAAQPVGEGMMADTVVLGLSEVQSQHKTDAYKWYSSIM